MKIRKNVEVLGFRTTLTFETNDSMGHKLLSENIELFGDICDKLDTTGQYIIEVLNKEKLTRKLT